MPKRSPHSSAKVIVSHSSSVLHLNNLLDTGKLLPALKSAICLNEKHGNHPKTLSSLMKLFKKWLSMSDDEKMAACGSDARILSEVGSEINNLGCPS